MSAFLGGSIIISTATVLVCFGYVPPSSLSNKQFGPKLIQSEQECSLDTSFGARDNIVKRREHVPRHKIPSPFKAQCGRGLQFALFRAEALVAVPLRAEKLNVLPGLIHTTTIIGVT